MTGDFPPDILKLAKSVVERGYDEGLVDAVARVLWDERERCAKVAESYIGGESISGADRIARAIRASVKL